MKIGLLVYSAILALHNIDQETLPQRCYQINNKIKVIDFAQWISGYDGQEHDEYYDLLLQKSDLMDCKNKNAQSSKYLRRYNFYQDHEANFFLHNAHCPELNKFLTEYAKNEDSCENSMQEKLFLDIQREADQLGCQDKIFPSDFENPTNK